MNMWAVTAQTDIPAPKLTLALGNSRSNKEFFLRLRNEDAFWHFTIPDFSFQSNCNQTQNLKYIYWEFVSHLNVKMETMFVNSKLNWI